MQSVWKFVVDEGPVLIPKNAKILAIHEQYPSICICWKPRAQDLYK